MCVCIVLQVYDVFTGQWMSLPSHDTPFTVSINPSGVVMWYVSPATRQMDTDEVGGYPNIRRKYRKSSLRHQQANGAYHFFT